MDNKERKGGLWSLKTTKLDKVQKKGDIAIYRSKMKNFNSLKEYEQFAKEYYLFLSSDNSNMEYQGEIGK
jgi:hypothetical protein